MRADRNKLDIAVARTGLSRKDIARKADMPLASVYNVFQGRIVRPKTLGRLAKALDVDVTDILNGDDES